MDPRRLSFGVWVTSCSNTAICLSMIGALPPIKSRYFYKAIMQRLKTHEFGLRATSRIKTFVFKFISVPAKWIKTSRRHVLNIYSDNNAYANLFKTLNYYAEQMNISSKYLTNIVSQAKKGGKYSELQPVYSLNLQQKCRRHKIPLPHKAT